MFHFTLFSSLLVTIGSLSAFGQTSVTCSEATTPSHVEIRISNPYQDSWVRVDVREIKADGSQVRTLHDLTPNAEHAQGLYQNHMIRLQIADVDSADAVPAHIDFLYDVGVRASADLVCRKSN